MRAIFKNLTPKAAFDKYADVEVEKPVEFFLSNFIYEGYTDLKTICRTYAREAVDAEDGLATTEEIEHVAKLLEQYIREYVKKIGGLKNLKLYTEDECNEISERIFDEAVKMIDYYLRRIR